MGLGLRAAAKELKISHVALLKAFKNGRVHKLADGTFDVDECRRAIELKSHPGKQRAARSQQTKSAAFPAADVRQEVASEPESGTSYSEAVRVKEWIRVEKEKLNLARQRGELAPIVEINAWAAGMIIRARDILLRIPPELRDKLAQEDDPVRCEELLVAEIHRSLGELAEYG